MTEQLALFTRDQPARLPPIAAHADPPSSHLAAAELTRSGARQRQIDRVVELVRRWPGCTSRELAEMAGMDYHLVARRLPDAKAAGLVTWIGGEKHPVQRAGTGAGSACNG